MRTRLGEVTSLAKEALNQVRNLSHRLRPAMLDELMRLGYSYDSSLFTAPTYYLAKAVVMGAAMEVGHASYNPKQEEFFCRVVADATGEEMHHAAAASETA